MGAKDFMIDGGTILKAGAGLAIVWQPWCYLENPAPEGDFTVRHTARKKAGPDTNRSFNHPSCSGGPTERLHATSLLFEGS